MDSQPSRGIIPSLSKGNSKLPPCIRLLLTYEETLEFLECVNLNYPAVLFVSRLSKIESHRISISLRLNSSQKLASVQWYQKS